jgi:hypothetical protein
VDVAMVHHGNIDEVIEKHKEWSVKEISWLQIRLW